MGIGLMLSLGVVQESVRVLRALGNRPFEAIMSPAAWESIVAEYRALYPGASRLGGPEILGVRVRLSNTAQGVTVKHAAGSALISDE